MMRLLICLLFCTILVLPVPAWTLDNPVREFGIRGGIDASGGKENYSAREVYLLYEFPWSVPIRALSDMRVRFDAGFGDLEGREKSGFWAAIGGDLVYRPFGDFLDFEAGWRPTWLSDYRFGDDDLGGSFQFSSHVGLALHWRKTTWGYRFQHISNAGIYDENPGLDLHFFSFGFRF